MEIVLPQPFTLPEIAANYQEIHAGMKRCGECAQIRPVKNFPRLIQGRQRYFACLPCRKAKMRTAYHKKKTQKASEP